MSTTTDNRIVKMEFDNSKFEKAVSTTLNTIEKLKKSLKLDKAGEAFEELGEAAKNLDFSPVVNGVQQVHNNFSLLDSFAINAFNRITNAAIDAGKKIVSALTIDPIKTGFQEYETQINAIQVMAANTGVLDTLSDDVERSAQEIARSFDAITTIWKGPNTIGNGSERYSALANMGLDVGYVQDNINKIASGQTASLKELQKQMSSTANGANAGIQHIEDVLEELNHYADKTIYNFTQMTQSIGQFTTAGIDIDTSATAVKGIANLAAYVGAPAQDASRIMFQLSQALAAGSVRLQDWMSLEHSAGMAGKIFQNELIATAEHMGIAAQEYIDAEGSFRASLKSNWLTSDVLTETLAKFSGSFDEEYWAALGYTDQEIQNIMTLGEVATDAATKVRTVSAMWDALKEAAQSTWTETWKYIVGDFYDAPKLLGWVNENVSEIIGNLNAARNEGLKFWYSAKISGRSTWFDSKNVIEPVMELVDVLDEAGNKVKDEEGNIVQEWQRAVVRDENGNAIKDKYGQVQYITEKVTKTTGILVDIWEALLEIIEPVSAALQDIFNTPFYKILINITTAMRKFAEWLRYTEKPLDNMYYTFKAIFGVGKLVLHIFGSLFKIGVTLAGVLLPKLANVLFGVTGNIGKLLTETGGIDILIDIVDSITDAVIDAILSIDEFFDNIIYSVIGFIESITGLSIDSFFDFIAEKVSEIFYYLSMFDAGSFLDSLLPVWEILKMVLLIVPGAIYGVANLITELTGVDLAGILGYIMDLISSIYYYISSIDLASLWENAAPFLESLSGIVMVLPGLLLAIPEAIQSLTGIDITGIPVKVIENLTTFFENIKNADFSSAITVLKTIGAVLIGIPAAIIGLPLILAGIVGIDIPKIVGGIVGSFRKLFAFFGNIDINKELEPFVTFFDDVVAGLNEAETIDDKINVVQEAFTKLWEALFKEPTGGTMMSKFQQFVAKIKTTFKSGVLDPLLAIPKKLKDSDWNGMFESLGEGIKSLLSAIGINDIGDAIDVTKIVVIVGILYNVFKTIHNIRSWTDNITDIGDAIADFFGGLNDTLEAVQKNLMAEVFLKIAAALGILTACILVISLIPVDNLSRAIAVMLVLFFGVRALVDSVGGAFGSGGIENAYAAGFALLGLAAVMSTLALAVLVFGFMDTTKLVQGLAAIYILVLAIGVLFKKMLFLDSTRLAGVGLVLVAAAVAIGVIAGAVALIAYSINKDGLDESRKDALFTSLKIVIASALMIFLLIYALLKIPRAEGSLALVGVTLIAASVAIGILAGVIVALSAATVLFGFYMISGCVMLAGLVTEIALLIMVLSKIRPAKLGGVMVTLIAVTGCIAVLAGCIAALAIIGASNAGPSLADVFTNMQILVGVFGLIVAILALATNKASLKGAVAIAIVMAAITTALSIIIGLIMSMSMIPKEDLENAVDIFEKIVIIIGAVVAVIMVLAAVVAALDKGGTRISLMIDASIAKFALFGIGLLAVAASIWIVIDAIEKIIELGKDPETFIGFFNGLMMIVTALIEVILQATPILVNAVLRAVLDVLKSIAYYIGPITYFLCQIIWQSIVGVASFLIKEIPTLVDILCRIVEVLGDSIYPLTVACLDFIIKFLNGLAYAIADRAADIIGAIANILSAIGYLFLVAFGALFGLDDSQVTDWLDHFWESWMISFNDFKKWLDEVFEYWKNGWKSFKEYWVSGIESLKNDFKKNGDKILDVLNMVLSAFLAPFQLFVITIKTIWNIVSSIAKLIWAVYKDIIDSWIVGFTDLNTWTTGWLEGLKDSWIKGIKKIFSPIIKLVAAIKNVFKTIGENVGEGYEEGIDESAPSAAKKTDLFVGFMKGLFTRKKGFDINSPSGFTEWVAKMCGKGFDKGITDSIPESASSVAEYIGAVKNEYKDQLTDFGTDETSFPDIFANAKYDDKDALSDMFDGFDTSEIDGNALFSDAFNDADLGDFDVNKFFGSDDITPVLNLDEYEGGFDVNSLFGNDSLNTSLAGCASPEELTASIRESIDNSVKIAAIANRLNNINGLLINVYKRMEDFEIYMDTGELVGAIADPMYDTIGTKIAHDTRAGGK